MTAMPSSCSPCIDLSQVTLEPSDKRVSKIRTAGYVPMGTVLEPIPDLAAAPTGPHPETPQRLQRPPLAERLKRIEPLAASEFSRLPRKSLWASTPTRIGPTMPATWTCQPTFSTD